mmetsp:Transcript_7173/g.19218  ORF Transcript_7173/g.19218 Transcript_7173/m.19218 type:complete len:119 (+) Transcript_7173:395-751(+)
MFNMRNGCSRLDIESAFEMFWRHRDVVPMIELTEQRSALTFLKLVEIKTSPCDQASRRRGVVIRRTSMYWSAVALHILRNSVAFNDVEVLSEWDRRSGRQGIIKGVAEVHVMSRLMEG